MNKFFFNSKKKIIFVLELYYLKIKTVFHSVRGDYQRRWSPSFFCLKAITSYVLCLLHFSHFSQRAKFRNQQIIVII
jgi:hypothetical protein